MASKTVPFVIQPIQFSLIVISDTAHLLLQRI